MTISRRELSVGCGMGALAWAAGLRPGHAAIAFPSQPPTLETLKELAAFALERARKAGASYADVRINRYRSQTVALRSQPDFHSGAINHVPSVSDSESFGFGLRVLAQGSWGFSASPRVTKDEIARAAKEAVEIARANAPLRRQPVKQAPLKAQTGVYRTTVTRDPFSVPVPREAGPPARHQR